MGSEPITEMQDEASQAPTSVATPSGDTEMELEERWAAQISALPEAAGHAVTLAVRSLLKDKAQEQVLISLAGKSAVADAMIIASGESSRQIIAMAEHLGRAFKAAGIEVLATEGTEAGDWVLIDANHLVIHLFRPEVREYYNLERLWATDFDAAPRTRLSQSA